MSLNALFSLPAPSITLALGGLTTSYVFFGNVAGYQRGAIAFLNGRLGSSVNSLGERARVRLWAKYFKNAMTWFVGLSFASAILSFTTAYLHPSYIIRQLALCSGATSLLIFPVTALSGLFAINSRLNALAAEGQEKEVEFKSDDEGRQLIQAWEKRHIRRFPVYAVAWGLNLAAILLDGRV